VQNVRAGFPTLGMPAYGGGPALSDEQLVQLASYILSRRGSNPPGAKPGDPARDTPCPPTT
jgi:mono/diheme cytochrome c family protein